MFLVKLVVIMGTSFHRGQKLSDWTSSDANEEIKGLFRHQATDLNTTLTIAIKHILTRQKDKSI